MTKYCLINEEEMKAILALIDDFNEQIELLSQQKLPESGTSFSLEVIERLITKITDELKDES